MKRKRSQDDDDDENREASGRHSSNSSRRDTSPKETELAMIDLQDLGAGYDAEDKNVAKAIKMYNEKLLPFIQDHQSIFAKSGFLKIKGYATNIKEFNKQ